MVYICGYAEITKVLHGSMAAQRMYDQQDLQFVVTRQAKAVSTRHSSVARRNVRKTRLISEMPSFKMLSILD